MCMYTSHEHVDGPRCLQSRAPTNTWMDPRTRGWTAQPPIPWNTKSRCRPDRAASNPVEHEVEVPPQTPTLVGGPEGTQGYTAEEQPIDCANEWARGQVIVSVARRLFGEELYICPQACDSVPFARRLVVVPKLGRQLL